MIIRELDISNLRAIESGEFQFQPGFNLIVGVNGVGKSTVLDALRICLSRTLIHLREPKTKPLSFTTRDIRKGFPFSEVSIELGMDEDPFQYRYLTWRESIPQDDPEALQELRRQVLEIDRPKTSGKLRPRNLLRDLETTQGVPPENTFNPSDISEWQARANTLGSMPLAVYFATNRSVTTASAPAKGKAVGGSAAAYTDALRPRRWNLIEMAQWMKVQIALAPENPVSAKHIEMFEKAASRFLPGCTSLRPSDDEDGTLLIEKGRTTLEVSQLSDGERGVLSMVLDLARRLSQANSGVGDPLANGSAIVLIDELDLHLHPKWQREVVRKLQETFPRCQFIATTHSPQIIGEVPRDRVSLLFPNGVGRPEVAQGADSNWILDHIMEGSSSETDIARTLQLQAENALSDGDLNAARDSIHKLSDLLQGPTGELSRLQGALASLELRRINRT